MSRSNNTEIQNPSTKWIQWSGSEGQLEVYNKETKVNDALPMPFHFLLLDELHTIKGFSESDNKGIYSNEIKDLKTQKLNVRIGKNTLEIGLYEDIKDAVKVKGGKYAKSCYIAYVDNDKVMKIGNIMMTGSSLAGGKYKDANKTEIEVGGWMDFVSKNKNEIYKNSIVMELHEQVCVKGANKYRIPKFKLVPITKPETETKAQELDKELQEYLKVYFANQGQSNQSTEPHVEAEEQEQEEKSFQERKQEIIENNRVPDNLPDGVDSLPF